MLGNKEPETCSAGSGCHASPQNKHRGLELRNGREQALPSRRECERRPAPSSQQIVLLQNGADWWTTLQTSRLTLKEDFLPYNYCILNSTTKNEVAVFVNI